jgi:hypothetical protein
LEKKGIAIGRRPELVGGALIKSQGGWSAVKAMHRIGVREKSDFLNSIATSALTVRYNSYMFN